MPYEAEAVAEPVTHGPDRPTAYDADDLHIARHLIRDLAVHFTAADGDVHAGHRAAARAMEGHRPRDGVEMLHAARIVALSMTEIEFLHAAAQPDVEPAMKARLASLALRLERAITQSERMLLRRQAPARKGRDPKADAAGAAPEKSPPVVAPAADQDRSGMDEAAAVREATPPVPADAPPAPTQAAMVRPSGARAASTPVVAVPATSGNIATVRLDSDKPTGDSRPAGSETGFRMDQATTRSGRPISGFAAFATREDAFIQQRAAAGR